MIKQKFENQSFARESGFTLIEILVVMFIIVMLVGLVGINPFRQLP